MRAANPVGDIESEAELKLAQIPPGFLQKLERAADVDEGEPLELKAKLDGSPIPTVAWYLHIYMMIIIIALSRFYQN